MGAEAENDIRYRITLSVIITLIAAEMVILTWIVGMMISYIIDDSRHKDLILNEAIFNEGM